MKGNAEFVTAILLPSSGHLCLESTHSARQELQTLHLLLPQIGLLLGKAEEENQKLEKTPPLEIGLLLEPLLLDLPQELL